MTSKLLSINIWWHSLFFLFMFMLLPQWVVESRRTANELINHNTNNFIVLSALRKNSIHLFGVWRGGRMDIMTLILGLFQSKTRTPFFFCCHLDRNPNQTRRYLFFSLYVSAIPCNLIDKTENNSIKQW